MQLNLKPNDNFNERLNQMKVLLAESGKNGKLKYVEDKLTKVSEGSWKERTTPFVYSSFDQLPIFVKLFEWKARSIH